MLLANFLEFSKFLQLINLNLVFLIFHSESNFTFPLSIWLREISIANGSFEALI